MKRNVEEKDGKVVSFEQNTVITDPDHELAVQIPEGSSGADENPLGVHSEPTPEEAFAAESKSSKSSKSDSK